MEFSTGDKFSPAAELEEGCTLDLSPSGILLVLNYDCPTTQEIASLSQGQHLDIRMITLRDVLFLVFKAGSNEWQDVPYMPPRSNDFALEPINDDHSGYPLTLLLVDAASNSILYVRKISLDNLFSKALYTAVMEQRKTAVDADVLSHRINTVYAMYSSRKMAEMAEISAEI